MRIGSAVLAFVACLVPALAAAHPAPAGEPLLLIDDPAALNVLSGAGLSLGHLLKVPGAGSTEALSRESAAFRFIAERIGADVRELRAEMKANGRALYEVTDGNVGRVLDLRWLASPHAAFRLAGLVHRPDRRDMHALHGRASCGEVRLIYRLAYDFTSRSGDRRFASRMPFSLNAVLDIPTSEQGDCRAAAAAFSPAAPLTSPEAVSRFILNGPLDPRRLTLRQIEVNAQIVRFPSGLETEFGGQAVYLLRAFGLEAGEGGLVVTVRPLENTPDAGRLAGDAALKAELVAFLRSIALAIDRGLFQLPERFLAERAYSISTFGSARTANHPFSALLDEREFAGLDFAANGSVRSPKGLLERLDQASCAGCHQANATAGFHLIGRDDGSTSPHNRIEIGISPHLFAELPRRAAYAKAVAAGREPPRDRPLPLAPPADWSGEGPRHRPAAAGLPCLPDEAREHLDPGFGCAAGLVCRVIAQNDRGRIDFGQCLPPAAVFAGVPCLEGRVETAAVPYRDRFKILRQIAAFAPRPTPTAYNCRPPKIGVPGGLSYRRCTPEDKRFAAFRAGATPPEICGMAGGKAFDVCVATNDFEMCLAASVVRGMRPTCGEGRFCREDYLCQSLPPDLAEIGKVKGLGYCSPTYFVFQMRLDGHPDPLPPPP